MILPLLVSTLALAAPKDPFLADLDLIRQRSLVLQAERGQLDANKAASLSRLFQATPSVSAGVGKSETRVDSDLTGKGKSIYDYWRLSVDWNLFRGFSDYYAWRAAKHSERAQDFQVRYQELEAELAGARAIFNRLYLRDAKQAQDELLKLKQETMRIGRDRYAQGKIPLQDVTKLEVDLSQQQNLSRSAELELAQNETAWKGFFVDELRTHEWPLSETQTLPLSEGEGSPKAKRLRERAQGLDLSWTSARLRHLPTLDLTVSYRELPLKTPNTGTWSGALELSIPLWSRFETASASSQAYASYLSAESDAASAERDETLRRDFLKKKIQLSHDNLKEARLIQEKAERLYRDMLRSFQLGRLSTNDLFQEQDRRIRAVLSYSQAQLSFHESLLEACALWGLSARECLR